MQRLARATLSALVAGSVLVVGSVQAQEGSAAALDGPLAGLEAPVSGLTSQSLAAALPARAACQGLIRLVNRSGAHWDLVREGTITVEQYRDYHEDQQEEWAIQWGSCVGRRKALADGLPAEVLAWEARLIERLWQGVRAVSSVYLDREEISAVNQQMAVYQAAAQVWSAAVPGCEAFWSGSLLANPLEASCVDQAQAEVRRAGGAVWALAGQPVQAQSLEAMAVVELALTQAEAARTTCPRTRPSDRVQLRLTARLLRAHSRGLEGLRSLDDDAVRAAMLEVQDITSRMARCREEHASDEAPSAVCSPVEGNREPPSEDGSGGQTPVDGRQP